jgi:uncharacterized protein YbjT (DUF2867 family)
MSEKALVAGASGELGRWVLRTLKERGYETRALIRDPAKAERLEGADEVAVVDLLDPGEALAGAMSGVEVVFSSVGETVSMGGREERRPFAEVDYPVNHALLEAALSAGVSKFAYVSVLNGTELRELGYVDAHERVVDELRSAAISETVIRANAFFYIYLEALERARHGSLVMIGEPDAKSNPIHERELAIACVDAIEAGERSVEVGGPQVLGRLAELEAPFEALGKKPRVKRVPKFLLKAGLVPLRRRDPRRAEMIEFVLAVTSREMIAPAHGEARLADYLREHAGD